MSAVEALAEVLAEHWIDDETLECECGVHFEDNDASWSHLGSIVVAAIRSMPAEQVAELIDGVTEDHGSNVDPHTRLPLNVTHRRAVGPWLPLGVSPETNGEQK